MIVFPDPVIKIREYFAECLPGIPVSAEVPRKLPKQFVTVTVTGGSRINVAYEQCLMAIQVWGDGGPETSKLARQVCALLREWGWHDDAPVTTVSTPYEFSDPDSNKHRYQMTMTANFRLEER